MHVVRLIIENFRVFRGTHQIDLGPGTWTVVAGREEDLAGSNGVGKSSLLAAIFYALYGRVPRCELADLVSEGEDSMRVELVLSTGLIVKRGVTKGAGWVDVTGVEDARMRDANDRIVELVGVSSADMSSTFFLGCGELGELAGSQAAARRDLVSRWVVPDLWRRVEQVAKAKATDKELALAQARGRTEALAAAGQQVALVEADLEQARRDLAELEATVPPAGPAPDDVRAAVKLAHLVREAVGAARTLDQLADMPALVGAPPAPDEIARRALAADRDKVRDRLGRANERLRELTALSRGEFQGDCPVDREPCPRADDIRAGAEKHGKALATGRGFIAEQRADLQRTEDALAEADRATKARERADREQAMLDERVGDVERRVDRAWEALANAGDRLHGARATFLAMRQTPPTDHAQRTRDAAGRAAALQERLKRVRRDVEQLAEWRAKEAELARLGAGWRWLERAAGRDGVPAMMVEGAVGAIAGDANAVLAGAGLRVEFRTRLVQKKLAGRCSGCGYAFDRKDKACPSCQAHRGPQVDPDMTVLVRRGDQPARDLALRSSGERMMVAVGLRIGAAAWRRRNAGVPWAVLVLDEAEGPLDEVNSTMMADIVHRGAPSLGFEQILVVSHRAASRSAQHVIRVVSSGPWSSLTVE